MHIHQHYSLLIDNGYRIHMAVCSKTDLPLAWKVETGRMNESPTVAPGSVSFFV